MGPRPAGFPNLGIPPFNHRWALSTSSATVLAILSTGRRTTSFRLRDNGDGNGFLAASAPPVTSLSASFSSFAGQPRVVNH